MEHGRGTGHGHGNGYAPAVMLNGQPHMRESGGARSKREALLETIRSAQAELEKLASWCAGERVMVPGTCAGYAEGGSGRILVRLDGVARPVAVDEDVVRKVKGEREADAGDAVGLGVGGENMEDTPSPLPRGLVGVSDANALREMRLRLEGLRGKRHADHNDMPCAACEAEAVLGLLDGVTALPEVEKWMGVKASGKWVDVSEVGRRRLVAIDKDSALQLAAALIRAAEAVEG